jgi:hypothetical protein
MWCSCLLWIGTDICQQHVAEVGLIYTQAVRRYTVVQSINAYAQLGVTTSAVLRRFKPGDQFVLKRGSQQADGGYTTKQLVHDKGYWLQVEDGLARNGWVPLTHPVTKSLRRCKAQQRQQQQQQPVEMRMRMRMAKSQMTLACPALNQALSRRTSSSWRRSRRMTRRTSGRTLKTCRECVVLHNMYDTDVELNAY